MIKRTAAAVSLIAAILLSLLLSSCSFRDTALSLMGFDTYDYEGEQVIEELDPECEEVERLCEMTKMLSLNNPSLPEFTSSTEALRSCHDSILNYMPCTDFPKYMGNVELIEKVEAEYPELGLISVIPAKDFENFVYSFFGGNAKVDHKSGELFTYLDKADVYTSVISPIENNVKVSVISCERTERTYRLKFSCSLGEVTSPVYRALIVNREDGTSYFKSLVIEASN